MMIPFLDLLTERRVAFIVEAQRGAVGLYLGCLEAGDPRQIIPDLAGQGEASAGVRLVLHLHPREGEAGDRPLEDTPADPGDGNRLHEPVTLIHELAERAVDAGVPLAGDLVDNEDERGPSASDPGSRLDELGGGEGKTEHHHHVEAIAVDAE